MKATYASTLNQIWQKINQLEEVLNTMAATQTDLDAALKSLTDTLAALQAQVASIKPPAPVDFTTEVTALNAAVSSLQSIATALQAL